ncbi:hypothetical protein VE03_08911 [Pseudogymnoascus sp. 23342-1-I1]|nr:hypothetical protein VE03_08911 [Pseudogymnoascus sp. 23342-1-I1]
MKWFPLLSPYQDPGNHFKSADDARSALALWKRRCYTLATLYILTMLLVVAYIPMPDSVATGIVLSEAYFGNIPKEMVKFGLNGAFVDAVPKAPKGQSVWDTLLPRGAGLVEVENPVNYGLRGGFPVPNTRVVTEIYSISMFHQLNCLSIIKDALDHNKAPGKHQAAGNNLSQCFDYLRQAIMCAGDTTLETAVVNADGHLGRSFDGWGDVHECRSYQTIFDFAEAHRVKDGIRPRQAVR